MFPATTTPNDAPTPHRVAYSAVPTVGGAGGKGVAVKGESKRRKSTPNTLRLRRKESDAKWRANIALCYDALRSFALRRPRQGDTRQAKAPKLSKIQILQETAKKVSYLEEVLKVLLIGNERNNLAPSGTVNPDALLQGVKAKFARRNYTMTMRKKAHPKKPSYKAARSLFEPHSPGSPSEVRGLLTPRAGQARLSAKKTSRGRDACATQASTITMIDNLSPMATSYSSLLLPDQAFTIEQEESGSEGLLPPCSYSDWPPEECASTETGWPLDNPLYDALADGHKLVCHEDPDFSSEDEEENHLGVKGHTAEVKGRIAEAKGYKSHVIRNYLHDPLLVPSGDRLSHRSEKDRLGGHSWQAARDREISEQCVPGQESISDFQDLSPCSAEIEDFHEPKNPMKPKLSKMERSPMLSQTSTHFQNLLDCGAPLLCSTQTRDSPEQPPSPWKSMDFETDYFGEFGCL